MRLRGSVAGVAMVAVVLAGCAVRLGGPKEEAYTAVAARAGGEDAAATAARLRANAPQLVLLSAPRDSAWFAGVAQAMDLKLSGPGRTGPSGLAFLTTLEAIGDTSLILEVPGGGRIHMHDALYEVDKERHIDLMLVQIEGEASLREAVRTLLGYYATDVGGTSAVVLGLETATPQAADSVALLLRSAFGSVAGCGEGRAGAAATGTLRLFYGPQARITCERGQVVHADPPTLTARVVVGR
jgi:hypothetical protein